MQKIHIAISVYNLDESIKDYTFRFGIKPEVIVPDRYALFRTEILNFSISKREGIEGGQLRHFGFEVDDTLKFKEEKDINGFIWEEFSASAQRDEILSRWPNAIFKENK